MRTLQYGLLALFALIILAASVVFGIQMWQIVASPAAEPVVVATLAPTADAAALLPPDTATPPPTATTAPTEPPPTATPLLATAESSASSLAVPGEDTPTATATISAEGGLPVPEWVGDSRQGRRIESYRFGNGPTPVLFVGGIHGGYEWNSILLAYEIMDYFVENPDAIPADLSVYVIPSANPDGQYLITGTTGHFDPPTISREEAFPGRFNSIGVDLNRNWDCYWSPEAYWRDELINAGEFAFSEPESQRLRDYIFNLKPAGVVFWHSAANGIYTSGCPDQLPGSAELADVYGTAANYPVFELFDAYPITGDAGDYLSLIGIPAITVELANGYDTDYDQNVRGMLATLELYSSLSAE